MRRLFVLILLVSSVSKFSAQEYITEGKNRLNFAKTYFELGGQYSPVFVGKKETNNLVQNFENPASIVPYFNIGGMHFWGHADFYISVPLSQFTLGKNDSTSFILNQSVVTGARFLPWAYKANKIRPFVGTSWTVVNFKQKVKLEEQPLLSKNKLIFDAGLIYNKGNFMIKSGVNFYPLSKWNYPLTPTDFQVIKTPNWSAYLGLVYAFETTRSKNMEKENSRLNAYSDISKPTLDAVKKGDWFVGIGPSSSFILSKSDYNETYFPYFNKKPISTTFVDMALGYHFNKLGMVTALSYRNPKFTNEAFGATQVIRKNSVAFELFKYLTDYSGFTPYVGLNFAFDNIKYSEKDNLHEIKMHSNKINPGITFGWDILPGKTEQWFVLRTNLRWYPISNFEVKGKKISQNQVEYNIIQAVFYPSRFKNLKSKKDK